MNQYRPATNATLSQSAKPARIAPQICPHYHRAIELIGRRWTGAILSAMLNGATRYTEIINAVPGLSDRLLSERLKELEAEGIVTRVVFPETPVRIEYLLTAKGRDLGEVTDAVTAWASRWSREAGVECRESEGECADSVSTTLDFRLRTPD
jgi:DNA-binding HxlR family transcriptional regulator